MLQQQQNKEEINQQLIKSFSDIQNGHLVKQLTLEK